MMTATTDNEGVAGISEDGMSDSASASAQPQWTGRSVLEAIGDDLDHHLTPRMFSGGVLWPSVALPDQTTTPADSSKGVSAHGEHGQEGAGEGHGPREESAGEAAGARGTPGAAASELGATHVTSALNIGGRDAQTPQEDNFRARELDGVTTEYPNLVLRHAPPGTWISGSLRPVPGYARSVYLIMVVPDDAILPVRSWVWTTEGVSLGPRHANPDGSVCAYEPDDDMAGWKRGQPVYELLDLVTTWVVRHFYLQGFGLWPGPQRLHTALERMFWHQPGEQCGCGSAATYELCHQAADRALTPEEFARDIGPVPRGTSVEMVRHGLVKRPAPSTLGKLATAAQQPVPRTIPANVGWALAALTNRLPPQINGRASP